MKRANAGFAILSVKLGFKFAPKLLGIGIKLLKGLKVGKVGLAAASFGSYSILFSWQFAVMVIFMLVIHEGGHLQAMKYYGMKTRGMYLIPFFGAAAVPDEDFPNYKAEAFIALAGPFAGLILSALTALLYQQTQIPLFAAAAGWMAAVNLFNLLPVYPLDGGRVLRAVSFSLHSAVGYTLLGLTMLGGIVASYEMGIGLLGFMAIVGGIDLLFEHRRSKPSAVQLAELDLWRDKSWEPLRNRCSDTLREEIERRIAETEQRLRELTSLDRRSMAWHEALDFVAVFGLLVWLLVAIMNSMGKVPGADLALELLKD